MPTIFPDILPTYGYSFTPTFRIIKLGQTDGNSFIQRRRKQLTPIHVLNLPFEKLSQNDASSIHDFFLNRYGSWDSFAVFNGHSFPMSGVSIGTGDGQTSGFSLNAKSVVSDTLNVYVAGTKKTLGVHYSLQPTSGTYGEDKIQFTGVPNVPTAGQAITADITGRKLFRSCIFGQDALEVQMEPYFLAGNNTFGFGEILIVEVPS